MKVKNQLFQCCDGYLLNRSFKHFCLIVIYKAFFPMRQSRSFVVLAYIAMIFSPRYIPNTIELFQHQTAFAFKTLMSPKSHSIDISNPLKAMLACCRPVSLGNCWAETTSYQFWVNMQVQLCVHNRKPHRVKLLMLTFM